VFPAIDRHGLAGQGLAAQAQTHGDDRQRQ
jgi:hypothetical protein